jgi:ADP-ribose pyrophosphatase YjhB (NUDIX family)
MFDRLLIKAILQPYWRLTRSQTLGVQGIVIRRDKQILLLRHSYTPGWHFPGGGVERHENLMQALHRELLEEVGVAIRGEPKLHAIFSNFARSKGDHIAVFIVDNWEQIERPQSQLEIIDWNFFSVNALPRGIIDGARRRLAEVFDGCPITPEW